MGSNAGKPLPRNTCRSNTKWATKKTHWTKTLCRQHHTYGETIYAINEIKQRPQYKSATQTKPVTKQTNTKNKQPTHQTRGGETHQRGANHRLSKQATYRKKYTNHHERANRFSNAKNEYHQRTIHRTQRRDKHPPTEGPNQPPQNKR